MKERFFLHYFYFFVFAASMAFLCCMGFFEIILHSLFERYQCYPIISICAIFISVACTGGVLLAGIINKIYSLKTLLILILVSFVAGFGISYWFTPPYYIPEIYRALYVCNAFNITALLLNVSILILFISKYKKEKRSNEEKSPVYSLFFIFFTCTFICSVLINIAALYYSEFLDYIESKYYTFFFIVFLLITVLSGIISVSVLGINTFRNKDKLVVLTILLIALSAFSFTTYGFLYYTEDNNNSGWAENYRISSRYEYFSNNLNDPTTENTEPEISEEYDAAYALIEKDIDGIPISKIYGYDSETDEPEAHEEMEETADFTEVEPVYIDSIWPKDIPLPDMVLAENHYRYRNYNYRPFDRFIPGSPFNYESDSMNLAGIPSNLLVYSLSEEKGIFEFHRILSFLDKNRSSINLRGLFNAYKDKFFEFYIQRRNDYIEVEIDLLLAVYYEMAEYNNFEEVYDLMIETAAEPNTEKHRKQYELLKPYISRNIYEQFVLNDYGDYSDYIKAYSFWGRRWKERNVEDCYAVLMEISSFMRELTEEEDEM